MDARLTQATELINEAGKDFETTQTMLVETQQQLSDANKQLALAKNWVTLQNIQTVMPEQLWYEARDASAPKTGPHGTVNISVGEPATFDFHPIVLPSGHSDNVYCLWRRYPYLTRSQKTSLETATNFSMSDIISLDPLANVQAAEWDYQIRKSNGIVINVGMQLLPDGTLRAFNFVTKDWEQLGHKINLVNASPNAFRVDATSDDKIVQFTKVIVNDIETAVTYSHPTTSTNVLNNPYFNCAKQWDGRADGKAYKAKVGFLTASFA